VCLCVKINSSLGSHISFVRSIGLDSWPNHHLEAMRHGGNQKCCEFLESTTTTTTTTTPTTTIREKYESPAAELYRQVLQARMAGTPEPTELPPKRRTEDTKVMNKKMQGFGSSPHPSEMEEGNKKKRAAILVGASSAAMAVGAIAIALASKKR
jgi:ADP-ribosylation factor GTPase-activating protein 1